MNWSKVRDKSGKMFIDPSAIEQHDYVAILLEDDSHLVFKDKYKGRGVPNGYGFKFAICPWVIPSTYVMREDILTLLAEGNYEVYEF